MTIQADEWEDVIIWDQAHILSVARELVHNAFLARKDGNFRLCSSYASKALDTLSDCEAEYPKAVKALRDSLEKL
jgi:hypothetical protein